MLTTSDAPDATPQASPAAEVMGESTTTTTAAPQAQVQDPKPSIPGWMAALPDELKGNEALKKYAKPGDFAKDALSWKERAERSVVPPSDKSTADELAAWKKAIGIPDSEDGYDVPEELEGEKITEEARKAFRAQALALGLTKKQADVLLAENARQLKAKKESQAQARDAQVKAVADHYQKEWGADYNQNLEIANRGFRTTPKALQDKATANGWVNDPDFVALMLDIGKSKAESDMVTGDNGGTPKRSAAEIMYPSHYKG
jgi:hypothetical protein